MIGILIVTHENLGEAFISAAELLLDFKIQGVMSISVNLKENIVSLRKKIIEGINKVDQKKGVLILTDLFGQTPSNLSYSLLEDGYVEVLAGMNLSIFLKAIECREGIKLKDLALMLEIFGKKNILLGSKILRGNKRRQKNGLSQTSNSR